MWDYVRLDQLRRGKGIRIQQEARVAADNRERRESCISRWLLCLLAAVVAKVMRC